MLNRVFVSGAIRAGDDSRFPTSFHRLQLSKGVRLVHRFTCRHVLFPLLQLL